MLPNFEFAHPQSMFFLWLNEQRQVLVPLSTLPCFELPPTQIEKLTIPSPFTSSSEGEEVPEVPVLPSGTRSGKAISRQGGSARFRGDETERDYHDPCFNPKKQKKNRNVLSNLVHHLLKYLSGKQMVLEKLSKIIKYH